MRRARQESRPGRRPAAIFRIWKLNMTNHAHLEESPFGLADRTWLEPATGATARTACGPANHGEHDQPRRTQSDHRYAAAPGEKTRN